MASILGKKSKSQNIKAYIIGGHGTEEGNETFIVPPGCIVVVKAFAGSVTKAYSFLEKGLCSLTPDILKHPITHYKDLEHVLGNLAIYKPGDVCPQFYYSLLQCYKYGDEDWWNTCNSFGSGVMDIDSIYADKGFLSCIKNSNRQNQEKVNKSKFLNVQSSIYNNNNNHIKYDAIYEYLQKLYRHSIFPTTEEIKAIIDEAIQYEAGTYPDRALDEILNYIESELNITQEDLCYEYPGVYYHIICRATPTGLTLFQRTNPNNNVYHVPSNITYLSSKPAVRSLLKKHISEAELHRKPYIKSMYEKHGPLLGPSLGPSRATLRRRAQRRRQKQKNKTKKNTNKKTAVRSLLKNHISEAELHRKSYIKSIYKKHGLSLEPSRPTSKKKSAASMTKTKNKTKKNTNKKND
jgi:hypothetical protein